MVLDGFAIRSFASASDLWLAFQQKPVRLIITERRFPDGFRGLDLTRQIRRYHQQFPPTPNAPARLQDFVQSVLPRHWEVVPVRDAEEALRLAEKAFIGLHVLSRV